MDGGLDDKASQGAAGEGDQGEQALAQGDQDAQADGAKGVAGGGADGGAADYQAALKAKDAQIAELQGKVAEAAKTFEATEALNAEIAALKQQMADERVEFALRAGGARSVKAAKALLGGARRRRCRARGGRALALRRCRDHFTKRFTGFRGRRDRPGARGRRGRLRRALHAPLGAHRRAR